MFKISVYNREKEAKTVMLTEERRRNIVKAVNERDIVTTQELVEMLGTSESTLRRDLICLDEEGLILKIHGGAARKEVTEFAPAENVSERHSRNRDKKMRIGKAAAALVRDSDIVYVDAGSTTDCLIDCLPETNATFVTNASMHAIKLMKRGFKVYVIGGELRRRTEAYIGAFSLDMLGRFNCTLGFFGADGVHPTAGYSTPEDDEAIVKKYATTRCKRAYALCDSSKFNKAAFVTFADIHSMKLISDGKPDFLDDEYVIKA